MHYLKFSAAFLFLSASCTGFLDEIPDRALAVPTTVGEFEQLLNFESHYTVSPAISEFGIDDFFLPYAVWNGASARIRNTYGWRPDIYEGNNGAGVLQDWNGPYGVIYVCNVVLDGLDALKDTGNPAHYRNVRGQALFLRAFYHYQLQEAYGQPFRPTTAGSDLGIPLRLDAIVQGRIARNTVAETYASIVADLRHALDLVTKERPDADRLWVSKAAVHAMLSRVHLTMQAYAEAKTHADGSLERYDRLLDFNDLPLTNAFPYPDHAEMLTRLTSGASTGLFLRTTTYVDTSLYQLYEEADLRKTHYFKPAPGTSYANFRNLYSGSSSPFAGLGVDEVLLNRAECRARLGDPNGALDDLGRLRRHRYRAGDSAPLATDDPADVLGAVLLERRKELLFRGTRWTDLRRLNQDPATATVLVRELGTDASFTLPPGDARYTLPMPDIEIALNGFTQNQR